MGNARPNGKCWCDCGGSPKPGSYFLAGHDKRAEAYLAAIEESESIADRLASNGFVPGGKGLRTATLDAGGGYEECGRLGLDGTPCRVIGRGIGMRRHQANDTRHSD
jgi:hypothetical protein